MGVTVNADGLSIVHVGSGGEANATSPDVCKTQVGPAVVPIPYGNNAKSADLANGSSTVTADGGNSIAIKGATFSKSTGDEAGAQMGVTSGTIQGEAEFTSASATVSIDGAGVCRLTDQMTMNASNTSCMGGVQNPSVSVEADAEGTYTLDIRCRYPNGKPYANADFELDSIDGSSVGSGTLDANGQASVSGLAPDECVLLLSESTDTYMPNATLPVNTSAQSYEDPQDFCRFVAAHRVPFWNRQVGVLNDWGMLISPYYSDDDFTEIVFEQARISAPYAVSSNYIRDFAYTFVGALYQIQDDKDTLEKYQPLLELLFEMAHENGDLLHILYHAYESDPPAILLAELRAYGTGNTLNYIQNMDWSAVNQQLSGFISDLIAALDGRLEYMQNQAQAQSYSVVEQGIQAYRDAMATMDKSLPDVFNQILTNLSDKLAKITSSADGALVNITGEQGFSTVGGEYNAVVHTLNNHPGRPPMTVFVDAFSD